MVAIATKPINGETMKNKTLISKELSMSQLAIRICSTVLMMSMVPGCSDKKAADPAMEEDTSSSGTAGTGSAGKSLATDTPTDSTGAFARLNLAFGTAASSPSALMLTGVPGDPISVGNGATITDARVNIKSIKIKANKERGSEEKALKDHLDEAKKTEEKNHEAEKGAIEKSKDDVEKKYEAMMEAAPTKEERNTIKDQMKTEMLVLEQDKAELEKVREQEEETYEAEHDSNLKWRGPFVYDLVKQTVNPELPAVDLLDGSYRRIEFKVKPSREAEETDSLLNKSIFITGSVVKADGTTESFEVALSVNKEFRLSGLGGVVLDSSAENSMKIAFDPAAWFAGIDLSVVAAGADGIIHVDGSNNLEIMAAISLNIVKSTRFGSDKDHDGKLGEDESEGDGTDGIAHDEAEQKIKELESGLQQQGEDENQVSK
jgi:hypothetical protein